MQNVHSSSILPAWPSARQRYVPGVPLPFKPHGLAVLLALAAWLSPGASRADEPLLRGPHPFLKDNELSLSGGYGVANDFHGVRAGLAYGYQMAGSLWLDLRLELVDAAAGQPPTPAPECVACAEVETFAGVLGGLKYKLRTEIPLVPYGALEAGPVFLFHRGAGGAVGIALRAAVGARYFLYEWLGLGVEIGGLLGAAAVDEAVGLESSLLMLDLGVAAEVQF
jgi:hypothetical protein